MWKKKKPDLKNLQIFGSKVRFMRQQNTDFGTKKKRK